MAGPVGAIGPRLPARAAPVRPGLLHVRASGYP